MRLLSNILFMAILGLAVSCQSGKYPDKVKEVESLMLSIDSLKKVYAAIDTSGYKGFRQSYVSKMRFVEADFKAKGDTMDRDLGMFIAKYRQLKKPYRDMKSHYTQAGKEIVFSEKQLLTLKHDLENGNLDEIHAAKFVSEEAQQVKVLVQGVNQLETMNNSTRLKANGLELQMDSVINVLKSK